MNRCISDLPDLSNIEKGALVEFSIPGDVDDLARCIRMLYRSPERLAELAEGRKKFTQKYNWTEIGAKYVALVERLSTR